MNRPLVFAACTLVAIGLAIAGLLQKGAGIAAFAVGLGVGAIGVAGLAALTKVLAAAAAERESEKRGVLLTLLAFALKIPLIVMIALWIQHWGSGAIGCFSGGIVLVYFLLVVGAASANAGTD